MDPRLAAFERMAARHWQATEQGRLGGWLLRAAGGFSGRANSALPLGDPGMPVERAVAEVESWYRQRGLPPMVVIVTALGAGPGTLKADPGTLKADPGTLEAGAGALDDLLARRGWPVRRAPAVVMSARTEMVAGRRRDVPLIFAAEPDEEWLAAWRYRGKRRPPQAVPVLLSAPAQVFASVRRDGRTVATGRLSLADGWGGLTAIAVDPAWRRAGLGTAITAGLAAQAAERGAERLFLQVEDGNAAARALYARCGFADRHRYHYRIAPA